MSEEELQKRADYVIINDGNMETLEEEIKKVWKEKKE